MIRILHRIEGFESKVNFIDENNVCLGYDLSGQCCERAEWYMTFHSELEVIDPSKRIDPNDLRLNSYVFDPDHMVRFTDPKHLDEGEAVQFRLTIQKHEEHEMYLVILNSHNGYYSHGFTFDNQKGDPISAGI